MKDPRIARFAEILVDYSTRVKKGDVVLISASGFEASPLVKELYALCLKRGAKYVEYSFSNPGDRPPVLQSGHQAAAGIFPAAQTRLLQKPDRLHRHLRRRKLHGHGQCPSAGHGGVPEDHQAADRPACQAYPLDGDALPDPCRRPGSQDEPGGVRGLPLLGLLYRLGRGITETGKAEETDRPYQAGQDRGSGYGHLLQYRRAAGDQVRRTLQHAGRRGLHRTGPRFRSGADHLQLSQHLPGQGIQRHQLSVQGRQDRQGFRRRRYGQSAQQDPRYRTRGPATSASSPSASTPASGSPCATSSSTKRSSARST